MEPYHHSVSSSTSPTSSESKTDSRRKQTVDDYEFVVNENGKLKTSDLGSGSYGRVKRVREKATGQIYAMKIMNKQAIFRSSSKENLKREIHIQKNIQHPHIIKLHNYFEDENNAYIVLEYAENGSLFEHIGKGIPENDAFIYFFQTCLGLQYIHNRNIIHRDLKPENLLLDANNNIKLCDFGWSTKARGCRQTYCGTIDYMAPEIIKDLPYDYKVDIWSLGILLYELLHGDPPFSGQTDQQKCYNIANNVAIQFGLHVSAEAADLIKRILKADPLYRPSMIDIFEHPWMRKKANSLGIDIISYLARQQDETGKSEIMPSGKIVSPGGSPVYSLYPNGKTEEYGSKLGQGNTGLNNDKYAYNQSTTNNYKEHHVQESSSKKSQNNMRDDYWWDSTVRPTVGLKQEHNLNAENFYREKKPQQTDFMSPKQGNAQGYSSPSQSMNYNQVEQQGKRISKYDDFKPSSSYDGERKTIIDSKEFSEIVYKNTEIERQLEHGRRNRQKPNLLEKMLMGIGVISKNPKVQEF